MNVYEKCVFVRVYCTHTVYLKFYSYKSKVKFGPGHLQISKHIPDVKWHVMNILLYRGTRLCGFVRTNAQKHTTKLRGLRQTEPCNRADRNSFVYFRFFPLFRVVNAKVLHFSMSCCHFPLGLKNQHPAQGSKVTAEIL